MYGYFVPVHQNSDELIPNPSIEHFVDSTVDYQEVYFMLGIITARAICEKNLVDTHYFDVYRINRWTQRGPNLLVKESEAIELKGVKSNEE